MDWLGCLPVILRSSTSHPRLNPLPASGRMAACTNNYVTNGGPLKGVASEEGMAT